MDIIIIALCASLCGANNWQEVVVFGRERIAWLKKFLRLPNGIPSHDTFERVFDRLDPFALQECVLEWLRSFSLKLDLGHIAIDGKTLRGSRRGSFKALHLVNAWACEAHLSLGQVAVDKKSNEITAIPKLLELLELEGVLVTIDAMGCQTKIAAQIVEQGGNYLLPVKENQPNLLYDIQDCFVRAFDARMQGVAYDEYQTQEKGHGREEKRHYTILYDPEGIRNQSDWCNLCVIGQCHTERTSQGETSEETRYFISDYRGTAKEFGTKLRGHWRIENNLHWQLDISFVEDGNRVAKRREAENLALIRRLALSLLKQHPAKLSINSKRLCAALNTDFLEEVLSCGDTLGEV